MIYKYTTRNNKKVNRVPVLNPFHSGTLANSEDPDKMPHSAALCGILSGPVLFA